MAIKQKIGTCIDCSKVGPIIAKRCKYCYWKYRASVKKKKDKEKDKGVTQIDMFLELFKKSNMKSELSGRDLRLFYLKYLNKDKNNQFHWMFHHLLNKNLYSRFKLYKPNIIILHPEEHTLCHEGTKKQIEDYCKKYDCDWSIIENRIIKLKKEYNGIKY